mmetsp:Transcript_1168/g.1973  ORF Transcript_1168/g.1973 Transcript_1168/m.1973 type:complete len:89 (-) Transcript_1168:177-443(-)
MRVANRIAHLNLIIRGGEVTQWLDLILATFDWLCSVVCLQLVIIRFLQDHLLGLLVQPINLVCGPAALDCGVEKSQVSQKEHHVEFLG